MVHAIPALKVFVIVLQAPGGIVEKGKLSLVLSVKGHVCGVGVGVCTVVSE